MGIWHLGEVEDDRHWTTGGRQTRSSERRSWHIEPAQTTQTTQTSARRIVLPLSERSAMYTMYTMYHTSSCRSCSPPSSSRPFGDACKHK